MLMARRALISVWEKRGVIDLARGLVELGVEIVSTGGTADALEEAEVPVKRVADVTGFPEILDGRLKTLHPAIHGGILADRSRSSHVKQLQEHGILPIDLVIANLYPFRAAAERTGSSDTEVIEMIDVGGPTMVRAAAKNHGGVVVVVDPDDYPQVLGALEEGDGQVPAALRLRLAVKAFRHTQAYDAAIARWLEARSTERERRFPNHLLLDLEREMEPRYGENPHQGAAVYGAQGGPGILGGYEQLQGTALSYNNLLDADAARRLVADLPSPAVVLVKHNNPCGVGTGESAADAFRRALACDPQSAYGSVVAVNARLDADLAAAIGELFVEVVLAPEIAEEAASTLSAKSRLRLLAAPIVRPPASEPELRQIAGGYLAQFPDVEAEDPDEWRCVTERRPTAEERAAAELAWRVVRHVRSNAIVIGDAEGTVGIGAGQMSRVDACRLAVEKAELPVAGTAAASDAFFPFADGLETLAEAGVAAVVQPGGSKRDEEVIAAADEAGMAMLFTGRRCFRH